MKNRKKIIEELLICVGMVIVMIVLVMLSGCCPTKQSLQPIISRHDSTAIKVRYRIEYRPVLAQFDIPDIRETRTTRDTMSFLENDYAESTATVSDGVLTHSLNTKPQKKSVNVDVPVEHTDSTVYASQREIKIKEVEKPLSWWQETQIKGFWGMLLSWVVFVAYIILRRKVVSPATTAKTWITKIIGFFKK